MRKSIRALCVTIGFLLAVGSSDALAGTATAELDKTVGSLEDQFQLVIAISGSYDEEAPLVTIPGVEVVNGGVSKNVQWVNGKYSSEVQYSYIIVPNGPGKFQVPSVKVTVDKKEIATLPIPFEVRGLEQGQSQGKGQSQGQSGAGQGAQQAGPPPVSPPADADEVFIERGLSSNSPYVGEGVMSTVRVYHRVRLTGGTPQRESAPDFRFIPVPGEKNYQQIIGGRRYGVIELKEVVVPLRSGDLSLPPFGLNASIVVPVVPKGNPGSVWDMLQGGAFGMGREVQKKIFSQATPLKVKAVPESGKPEGYTGLVGDFRLKGNVSKSTIAAGDTVTITLIVDGNGLLEVLGEVKLSMDSIGKTYADKPVSDVSFTGDVIRSKKELKFALVPQRAGTFELGVVEIPVFSTRTGSFEVLRAELGTLNVTGAEGGVSADIATGPALKSSVKLLGNDLLAQHASGLLTNEHNLSTRTIFLYSTIGLSTWFLGLGLLGYRGVRRKMDADGARARRSSAQKKFLKAVKIAEKLSATDPSASVAKVRTALYDFIGDKTNINAATMATKELLDTIGSAGASQEVQALASRSIKDMERLEYGGLTIDMSAALKAIELATAAVASLEVKI